MANIIHGIILFNLVNFILLSSEEFIKNPVKIIDDSDIDDYIIDLDKVYFRYDIYRLYIQKDNMQIKYEDQTFYLSPNFTLCQDQSNLNYLLAKFNYYKIIQNNDIIQSLNYIMQLPPEVKYNGFIKEKQFNSNSVFSTIKKDEIVIYGKL